MGATNVSNLSSPMIWGYVGENTIGVWCRGTEAIVTVAGDLNAPTLREEVTQVLGLPLPLLTLRGQGASFPSVHSVHLLAKPV